MTVIAPKHVGAVIKNCDNIYMFKRKNPLRIEIFTDVSYNIDKLQQFIYQVEFKIE
jgi:hypothetical protein